MNERAQSQTNQPTLWRYFQSNREIKQTIAFVCAVLIDSINKLQFKRSSKKLAHQSHVNLNEILFALLKGQGKLCGICAILQCTQPNKKITSENETCIFRDEKKNDWQLTRNYFGNRCLSRTMMAAICIQMPVFCSIIASAKQEL